VHLTSRCFAFLPTPCMNHPPRDRISVVRLDSGDFPLPVPGLLPSGLVFAREFNSGASAAVTWEGGLKSLAWQIGHGSAAGDHSAASGSVLARASRRALGPAMTVVGAIFLAYSYFGKRAW